MNLIIIIAAAVSVILVILAIKVLKTALKWAVIILVLVVFASFVFGVNLLEDVNTLKENLPKAQNVLLLEQDGKIVTGYVGKLVNREKIAAYIDEAQLASYQSFYQSKDFESMRRNSFKLIIFDINKIDRNYIVNFNNHNLTSGLIIDIIKSDFTLEKVVSLMIQQENLSESDNLRAYIKNELKSRNSVSDDQGARSLLFALLVGSADSIVMVNGIQNNALSVYPDSIVFKMIKLVPESIAEWLLKWVIG